jgi:hypothetical protein
MVPTFHFILAKVTVARDIISAILSSPAVAKSSRIVQKLLFNTYQVMTGGKSASLLNFSLFWVI